MAVYMTSQLRGYLLSINVDPDAFMDEFRSWKAEWPKREYESELFGKDGAYGTPLVDGNANVLRHAHITPIHPNKRKSWMKRHFRKSRKTSDRHLIYVKDDGDYLLIYVLEDPDAHEVAKMKTSADRTAMMQFALVAENFIIDGEVP